VKGKKMPPRNVNGAWYVDRWVTLPGQSPKRLRKRSPIQTKKACARYEEELVAAALCPSDDREERRFSEFAVEFLENYVKVQCKYSTIVSYESALSEHLVPFFRNALLRDISQRDIAELQAALSEGRSKKTVRNITAVLTSLLRVGKQWGYVDALPTVTYPKIEPSKVRFLSLGECLKLERAASEYWRPMIHVARKTGLRLGELCALSWEQIDLDAGTIFVDRAVWRGRVSAPKHNKVRGVPLSPRTIEVLRGLHESAGRSGALVFPSTRGEIRLERKCDLGLRRCAQRAGLRPFGWHIMRHTFASHLVMAGEPLPVVQELLGHSDIRMTMRYAHLSPGRKVDAVLSLDQAEDRLGQQLGIGGGRDADAPEGVALTKENPRRIPGVFQRGGRDSKKYGNLDASSSETRPWPVRPRSHSESPCHPGASWYVQLRPGMQSYGNLTATQRCLNGGILARRGTASSVAPTPIPPSCS
jgi:integrase